MSPRMPEPRLDPPDDPEVPERYIKQAEERLGQSFIDRQFPLLNGCVTKEQEALIRDWLDDHEDEVLREAEELWMEDERAQELAYDRHRDHLRQMDEQQ